MNKVFLRVIEDPNPLVHTLVMRLKKSLPIGLSPRGILAHRPKGGHITTRYTDKLRLNVEFWCGGSYRGDPEKFGFFASLPSHRVVCHKCELAAIQAGEQPISEVIGEYTPTGLTKHYKTERKRFQIEVLS